jgi:hypothetical protein
VAVFWGAATPSWWNFQTYKTFLIFMTQRNLIYLSVATLAIICAAVYYLTFQGDSMEDAARSSAGTDGAGSGSSADVRSSIVRKDDTLEKKGNTPPSFDPAEFTTAPKPNTEEGRLVKLFTDRNIPDAEKVERLLAMVSELSGKGKHTAMDYATQLITDEDYVRQRPRLLRLATTDELREVVMLDMLTRDDGIKMPSLVELLSVPSQTTRSEAREILAAFLEQDYGDDPRKWHEPLMKWLAENEEV